MYRIAVCEDDPRTAEQNKAATCHALDGRGRIRGQDYDVDVFHAAAPLMERLSADSGAYQLLLLDIQLDRDNGVELARFLREHEVDASIIYITDHPGFALDSFPTYPLEYLLKPVDPDELEASVRRAIRQIQTERKLEELAAAQPQPQPEPPAAGEEAEESPEEGENSQAALIMAHVRRYLEDNYMFDLSLDSVGEILHISPAYLSAQFKKYQKMNFLDCLTELRINAAKELLTDPFRSSAEVASMVGYEDASYFARAFKKRTGMTPTQYRRQAGQKAKSDPEAEL